MLGAALALSLILAVSYSRDAFNVIFRSDAALIDLWQRFAGPDEPTGEVVTVGIDAAAIRTKGRWPWGRAELAELVEIIAATKPKSLTLDILLTEPGPYSEVNLIRTFRARGPEVIAMLPNDPDTRLAAAIGSLPTTLAVAAGPAAAIDDLPGQTECADPELLKGDGAHPFHVECLLLPVPELDAMAAGYAVTFAEQDLDGIVRRARAFVGQPFQDSEGRKGNVLLPAMPVAMLTACNAPDCLSYDPAMGFLSEGGMGAYRLELRATNGQGPPPVPLTPSLAIWLDFGALAGLRAEGTGPGRMVSAASLFRQDEAEMARLTGKHVILGLARLGAIDQYTTPLASDSGTPGVLIQALAADNILSGRVLEAPEWARIAGLVYAGFTIFLALVRFGGVPVTGLLGLGVLAILAPIGASWAAFAFGGKVVFATLPSLSALLAGAPVLYGRISALRRDLADARDASLREEERMDAARSIQLGSLPFDADFTDIGFETASICRPAQEVGGDFFELFRLSDGRLFAAVGDVAGKGLEASLVTALSKSIVGAVTDRTSGPVGVALGEIAREFIRQAPSDWRHEKGGFVTLVIARIDPDTGEAEFAAAGCEPPTVYSRTGQRRPVGLPAVAPLGWLDKAHFETARMTLAPGDLILMFTDGVTEAETRDGALFGQKRAEKIARENAAHGPAAVIRALDEAVGRHQAGGEPTDDTTILAIAWNGAKS